MTVAEVKTQLPDVQIYVNGRICAGRPQGRNNRFATVWVPDVTQTGWIFSWQAIKRSLDTGVPLRS